MKYHTGPRALTDICVGSPKNIQIRWPARCSRLSCRALWAGFWTGFWKENGQGNYAFHSRKVSHSGNFSHYDDRQLLIVLRCTSLIGIGEIVLLPLDVLKIKRQTNPEAFRGRGILKIIADEGLGLYRGWGWTAARNAPGSFAVRIHPMMMTAGTKADHCGLSYLAALLLRKNFSSSLMTIMRLLGSRILLRPLRALQRLLSCLRL